MTSIRDAVQDRMPRPIPVVDTSSGTFYAASSFTTSMSPPDWRIYWVGEGSEGWLLRFTGADAEIKAKAVAMILNAEST